VYLSRTELTRRRLIAHSTTRYTSLTQVKDHPFFAGVLWDDLRAVHAPFVPALDSEVDVGYYDDFTSAEDMAKYAEVQEKQRNVDRVRETDDSFGRGVWVGFTYGKNGAGAQVARALASDDGAFSTMF